MEPRHPHHHVTHAKISSQANFMVPRHPRKNFGPRHSRHFFNSRQNFMDPRYPRQNFDHTTHPIFLTHAKILQAHAKAWPTPPTHPRYPRHPRYLVDSEKYDRYT